MRDVFYGWLIRYAHANGASFFFICVYIHMARGLYYNSYSKPRVLLWSVGVIIFFIMMATAFLGFKNSPRWLIQDIDFLTYSTVVISTTPPSGLHPNFYKYLDKLKEKGVTPKHFIVSPNRDSIKKVCNEYYFRKGGYYWWFNNNTGEHYIGSAVTLLKRLSDYFLPSKLKIPLNIYINLNKYGHSKFILVILEVYGPSSVCISNKKLFYERESFFLSIFKSFDDCLNILYLGNSSLGYLHSEETKKRMKENYSQERRDLVAKLNKGGITNPNHIVNISKRTFEFWNSNSKRSIELKAQYSERYGTTIGLYNVNMKLIKYYPSFNAAGKDLKACRKYLSKICNSDKLFREQYFIKTINKS